MPESIEDGIRKWLTEKGYRFELIAARAFKAAGFDIRVSPYVRDPDSKNLREVDLIATHTSFLTPACLFDLSFVVECKYSANPWIVFRSPGEIHLGETFRFLNRISTSLGSFALLEMGTMDDKSSLRLLELNPKLGHGVRAMTEKADRDPAYEAMMQVCAAAAGMAAETEEAYRRPSIIFPVVAVQGRLFECCITDSLQLNLEEVQRATVVWTRPTAKSDTVFIDLVTEASLGQYATEKFNQCEALRRTIEKGLDRTRERASSK